MKPVDSALIRRLGNALGFQLGWWLCVCSVRHDFQAWALLAAGVLCALQWRLSAETGHLLGLIWRVAGGGVAIDSALQALGWIQFEGWALGALAPYWLWAIWLMFALTLNESMAFLSRWSSGAQALAGALAGPMSYGAGVALGAAQWGQPWAWAVYALVWTVWLPLVLKWAQVAPHAESAQ